MIKYEKMILISIKEQKLILIQDNYKIAEYPISTSKFGIGNKSGSNMTPLGYHLIKEKIGEHIHKNTIYKAGKFTKENATTNNKKAFDEDLITTRIIKLEGMENGINRGSGIDSYDREIWIHGKERKYPKAHICRQDDHGSLGKKYDLHGP